MFDTQILRLWLLKNIYIYLNSKNIIAEKNYDSEMVQRKRADFGHIRKLQGSTLQTIR